MLLEPQPIFPENVKDVVADGYEEASAICTNAKLKAACEEERGRLAAQTGGGRPRAPAAAPST